ncbi:MAG: 3-dehydroquinate synthase [Chloroflexi bacterium]|nr:3-dehydroquinate synthase [Chloroflexota bacterium]
MIDNIILIGFSTTGKSQVGRRLAERLGWGFIDADEEIVRKEGKPIPDIFAQEGEARFRRLEHDALVTACQGERNVIATGGGAILDPHNRQLMLKRGMVICLEAEPATIYERLMRDNQDAASPNIRPLLAVADPLERIQELKAQRQAYYAIAHHTIPTDNLTIEAVAGEAMRAWKKWSQTEGPCLMPVAEVKTDKGGCPIFVGWGCVDNLATLMRQAGLTRRAMLISDETVLALYGERVMALLRAGGFEPCALAVPPGESTKNIENAVKIYDFLVEHRVERDDAVVALGGGVVGDLAGFVAATFLRGIPWVAVPTSLVAMVDAGIGGKVAVDHPQGKNLIGAFHQPALVMADAGALSTLPARELASGWAEVIKHGVIRDAGLFSFLEVQANSLLSLDPETVTEALARGVRVKARVVSEDERETSGKRMILNYGHTIGHALEAATGYTRFLHGEAVSIGMMCAARLSQRLGLVSEDVVRKQQQVLDRFSLPLSASGVSIDQVLRATELDKKTREGSIHWVLLRGIGEVITLHRVPQPEVISVLEEFLRP